MKTIKFATSTTIVAGALCAALLAGCGGNVTAKSDPATQAGAAEAATSASASSTTDFASTDDASQADALYDFTTSPSDYANLNSFTAKTMDGGTFTQADLAKADVTLINYWATTCGFCVDELPDIAAWAKKLPANVQVITVCGDYEFESEAAKAILKEAGFEGTTLVSGDGDFEKFSNDIIFLPTTVVVDSSGNIVETLDVAAKDVSGTFTKLVNAALEAAGKDAISV